MSLDKATVAKIAELARIKVPDAELEHLAGELSQIIGWVEQLGEVDTDAVPPVTSVVEAVLPRRRDEVVDGRYPEKVLANAPDAAHRSEEHTSELPSLMRIPYALFCFT